MTKYHVGDLLQDQEYEDNFVLVLDLVYDPTWPGMEDRLMILYLKNRETISRSISTMRQHYKVIARTEP